MRCILTSAALCAIACAGVQASPDWVTKSNQNAKLLIDVFARYSPESASSEGVSGLDEKITSLPPGRAERLRHDIAEARAKLQGRLAAEKDPLVRQDLEILIAAADRDLRSSA